MNRLSKQLIYGGAFLLIVFGVLWLGYRAVVPGATCSDGIQNQGEEGLDCGAVCGINCPPPLQALVPHAVQVIRYGDGSYDAVAELENPNAAYGASKVDYSLVLTDQAGAEIMRRRGTTYVNPVQPRYLVFPLSGITQKPAKAELQFDPAQVQWGALNIDQAGSVQFPVRREEMQAASGSFRYSATATNRSNFDFDRVDVTVLLYDPAGTLIGAGTTVLKTVTAGEERAFVVDWPFAVSGVSRAQTIITTNVFDNANYIRTYGSHEKFQEY